MIRYERRLRGPFVRHGPSQQPNGNGDAMGRPSDGDKRQQASSQLVVELKRARRELADRVADLEGQIERERERSASLEAIVHRYQQDGEAQQTNIHGMLAEVERMKRQRNDENAKYVELERELEAAKQGCAAAEHGLAELRTEIEAERAKTTKESEDDEDDRERRAEEVATLSAQLADAQRELDRLEAELARVTDAAQTKEREWEREREARENERRAEADEIEQQLKSIVDRL